MFEMCWNRRLFPIFFSTSCFHSLRVLCTSTIFAVWHTKAQCTLFVVCRIIKSDVTIIFILLLALGLIANYCYWVFAVRVCVSLSLCVFEWVSIWAKICDCVRGAILALAALHAHWIPKTEMWYDFFLSRLRSLCVFSSLATRFANRLAYLRYIEYLTNRFTFRWLAMVGGCFFFIAAILMASIRLSILRRFSRWVMWCVHRTCYLLFFFLSFSHSTLLCKFRS